MNGSNLCEQLAYIWQKCCTAGKRPALTREGMAASQYEFPRLTETKSSIRLIRVSQSESHTYDRARAYWRTDQVFDPNRELLLFLNALDVCIRTAHSPSATYTHQWCD